MRSQLVSFGKFFVKMRLVAPLRALLLRLFGPPPSRAGWEKRLLIINLEALGDLLLCTSTLKHYKRVFPDRRISLLIKSGTGLDAFLRRAFVDEVMTVNYRRWGADPFYGFSVIASLRRIGFRTVVNQDFSAAEIAGKIIATSLEAEQVVGSDGLAIEYDHPFDLQQMKNLRIVERRILPRYTAVVPTRGLGRGEKKIRLPNAIAYYAKIFEEVAGAPAPDYATTLPAPEDTVVTVQKFRLTPGRYAIVNVSASVPYKRWPVERFVAVSDVLLGRGLTPVVIGVEIDRPVADRFASQVAGAVNLVGRTSFEELVALVAQSALVLTNDTSTVHLAVALQKPSLCIGGGGPAGIFEDYGYPDINLWAYAWSDCFGDNWQCAASAPRGGPAPCVALVSTDVVREKLQTLLGYLKAAGEKPRSPSSFHIRQVPDYGRPGLGEERRVEPQRGGEITIVYSGIQCENYNPRRGPSFEYSNFYLTLKNMPGVRVVEFPLDAVIPLGKKKFNEELVHLIEREKPDLFFAFMFTDEFDAAALEEVKKHTTSLAWFADDHWRLANYSRYYAPHFTWVVTTWSKAPEIYRSYGIQNVIRSQWACNPAVWRPVPTKRDIEVSFIGQYTAGRAAAIRELQKAGVKVWVRGWGWPEGRLSQKEMIEGFSRTKVNLNFNVPPGLWRPRSLIRLFFKRSVGRIVPDFQNFFSNVASWRGMAIPQIKARPFEILACRTFLISGFADDMETYYENGKEIVYYDGTTDDLVRKIAYYLKHDAERERIAQAGYERTLREHAYEERFRTIFRQIGLR